MELRKYDDEAGAPCPRRRRDAFLTESASITVPCGYLAIRKKIEYYRKSRIICVEFAVRPDEVRQREISTRHGLLSLVFAPPPRPPAARCLLRILTRYFYLATRPWKSSTETHSSGRLRPHAGSSCFSFRAVPSPLSLSHDAAHVRTLHTLHNNLSVQPNNTRHAHPSC